MVPSSPLLPLGGPDVLVRAQHRDLVHPEYPGDRVPQVVVAGHRHGARSYRGGVPVRGQRPGPRLALQEGVLDEGGPVDHGHHRVQVHHGPRGRQLDGDDPARLASPEQRAGQQLDRHRGGPLAHPDHHRAVPEHVHVAALDGGGLVVRVVVAVVPGEVGGGEHRVEPVDGPAVQGLPLPGGLGHRVDRHALVDPAGVVPREQVVGQRRQHEVVGPEHVPLQADLRPPVRRQPGPAPARCPPGAP